MYFYIGNTFVFLPLCATLEDISNFLMLCTAFTLVMSIGYQEFGIPRKYQYQIGIWYLCLKFLGIFLVFYRNLEYHRVKSWFNINIFRQNKSVWFFGFCGCHFIGIGLVTVCHFPENGISSLHKRFQASAETIDWESYRHLSRGGQLGRIAQLANALALTSPLVRRVAGSNPAAVRRFLNFPGRIR